MRKRPDKNDTLPLRPRFDGVHPEPDASYTYQFGIPKQLILSLPDHSTRLNIELGSVLIIGRRDSDADYEVAVDLTPYDARNYGVSHYHVVIRADDDRVTVQDMESLNGTALNDQLLDPNYTYPLHPGDELVLGTLRIQVGFAGRR